MENIKIKINNIGFAYHGNDKRLVDIDLDIIRGECLAVIGRSGCGKSTLTRVINGLIPSFYQGDLSGDVLIDNKSLRKLETWEISILVGNVFQDPRSQFFANEVAGEIAFGCENLGLNHYEIVDRVQKSAKEMDVLGLLNKSIYTLSYGMRQRVAICSAKAMQPDIYIFDEPSANLDLKSTYQFGKMIQKLKDEGKTIIIVEHRLFYLSSLADRYIFMVDGKIKKNFSSNEFKALSSKELNGMGLRSLNFEDVALENFTDKTYQYNKNFSVNNISKKYGKNLLLSNINFKFDSNEIIALIGPNGVGKSTLGKICSGLQQETTGKILLEDKEIKRKRRLEKIWYIPQDLDSQLFGEDLVDELVTGLKDKEKYVEKAEGILKQLGLYELKNQHPSTLSGGQKQRLVLGVAMMRNISVVILDEPTSGLDYGSMEQVSKLIKSQRDLGTKFLIISHDIEFIAKISERIIKIQNGRIVEDYYLTDMKTLLNSMGYER